MSPRTLRLAVLTPLLAVVALLPAATPAAAASAQEVEEGVAWRLEQPPPPVPPVGVTGSSTPIGLGAVGDVEFEARNRAVLITAGNGSTIPAGLWAYNGREWHELANVCGATDGRIAWAGPEEFWTISDGRPGQAANPRTGEPAPLADRTLCRFAGGQVVGSYASPAFQASSYQAMHALGCISPDDCWFAGGPLPDDTGEAFHLQWNGSSLTAEPTRQGHVVEDMRLFESRLYESALLAPGDAEEEPETPFPFALHTINPAGVSPTVEPVLGMPLYSAQEFPQALNFLHLGSDGQSLWAAAGPVAEPPAGSSPAPVTVLRTEGGEWTQVLGPEATLPGAAAIAGDVVNSIAPEPGTDSAWVALDTPTDAQQPSPNAAAVVAHITPEGEVETQTLPAADAGIGPKGAAKQIVCAAFNDCWLITTQGWIFHLAPQDERQLSEDEADHSQAFSSLITFRPKDLGLPPDQLDAPPPDDSGELPPLVPELTPITQAEIAATEVPVALLTNVRSRLLGRTTLELRFHLAVEARVRLVAKRKATVVASTPNRTLAGGDRRLLLRLSRRKWPTKLDLQTHALAPLPLRPRGALGDEPITISGLRVLPPTPTLAQADSLTTSPFSSAP
ncbi:MAG TPA: hypothetical protein VK721_06655 [Solirubrobacteraceae bacterium]|nr:hypothetical protein [Solirubrobacteraceae bacterium]